MRKVVITLDDNDKITLETRDFSGDEYELFHVLATSTRQIAQLIENSKPK